MAKGNIEYKDHPGPGGYTIIEGILGKDPERRENGDKTIVSFNVATQKYDFAEKQQVTVWVQVTVMGYNADRHYDNLRKGDRVSVMGDLKATTGEDLDSGEAVKVFWKLFASDVHYTGRGKSRDEDDQNGSEETEEEKPRKKKRRETEPEPASVNEDADEVDDLFGG